jgi:hypothetical protein
LKLTGGYPNHGFWFGEFPQTLTFKYFVLVEFLCD